MSWASRPEAATVKNPHNMRHGRAMHHFVKFGGEWVCTICEPLLTKPGPPRSPQGEEVVPASLPASAGRHIPARGPLPGHSVATVKDHNEIRHAAESKRTRKRRTR